MNCNQLKSLTESANNGEALTYTSDLVNIIPALCEVGVVGLRPSKTGIRVFVSQLSNDKSTIIGIHKIKIVDGLTQYSSLDIEDNNAVVENIEESYDHIHLTEEADHLSAVSKFSALKVADSCETSTVALRPSKTGVRMLQQYENGEVIKTRHLVDGTYDVAIIENAPAIH